MLLQSMYNIFNYNIKDEKTMLKISLSSVIAATTILLISGCSQSYPRSEEHTSELQSHHDRVCRLLLEKKNKEIITH